MRKLSESDFWARVSKVDPNSCWPWTGCKTKQGYGTATISGLKTVTHRMAYLYAFGPIPAGAVIMHTCDNRACCNPAHLRVGTQKDNLDDMRAKGRQGYTGHPGERHHKAKITAADAEEIRRLYGTGKFSQAALGARYGLSQPTVGRIVLGRGWLTPPS